MSQSISESIIWITKCPSTSDLWLFPKGWHEKMASTGNQLLDADISKVTDIVSADNRLRFSVEYLGIDRNEYKTIEADAKFIHHDTLFECIRRWKNRTEAAGNNARDELIRILTQIRKEHGWFPFDLMAFLTDITGMKIPKESKPSGIIVPHCVEPSIRWICPKPCQFMTCCHPGVRCVTQCGEVDALE